MVRMNTDAKQIPMGTDQPSVTAGLNETFKVEQPTGCIPTRGEGHQQNSSSQQAKPFHPAVFRSNPNGHRADISDRIDLAMAQSVAQPRPEDLRHAPPERRETSGKKYVATGSSAKARTDVSKACGQ